MAGRVIRRGAKWGGITGTLSAQTDLQNALNAKAALASPALTGTPTAPTASAGTNSTRIATTAFVQSELAAERIYTIRLWESTVSYTIGARVHFSGVVYISLDEPNLNNIPALGSAFWAPAVSWGTIGGTLADQVDLQNALDAKLDGTPESMPFSNGGLIDNATDDTLLIKGATDTASGGVKMLSSNGASGSFEVTNNFAGVTKNGEAYSRTIIQHADGKIGFGPGNAPRDTWLYRSASGVLKTDGAIEAASGVCKTGSGTFTSGTTHTVTDPWITASTFVSVSPTGTKAGTWTVDSAAGSFTITSTASESGVTFDWGAIK